MTAEPPSTPAELPVRGALLGLDHGTRRWGLAVCNIEQTIAVPLETWSLRNPTLDRKHLREVIDDYRIVGLVIGLPMRLNGVEGDQAALVRRFGEELGQTLHRPVVYWDERYSSVEAEVLMWSQGISPTKKKEQLDRLAAKVILQSYLDSPAHRQALKPETQPPE